MLNMDSKGDGHLDVLMPSRATEYTLNNGGYVSLLFGGILLLGCVSAYVIAVARGNVDAFLPLISDAAGSPPQNGLFGTLICLGGMLGVFCMFLRYMIVEEQNQQVSKVAKTLNKISLAVGLASMCGITLITGYPINFYRSKDVWLSDVGIPHMIGGIMLFSLGLIYTAIQCILTLLMTSKNRTLLLTRIVLCLAATAAFVSHLITVPDNFGRLSVTNPMNLTTSNGSSTTAASPVTFSSIKLPIEKSGTYLSSAITEWILVFLFCCFFFTFFSEAQQYSFLVVIETHSPQPEMVNEATTERKSTLSAKVESGPNQKSRPSIVSIGGNESMKAIPKIRSGFPPKVPKRNSIQDNAHVMKKRLSVTADNGAALRESSDSHEQVEKHDNRTTLISQEGNVEVQKSSISNGTTPSSNGGVTSNNTLKQTKEAVSENERGPLEHLVIAEKEQDQTNNANNENKMEKECAIYDNGITQSSDIAVPNSNGLHVGKEPTERE